MHDAPLHAFPYDAFQQRAIDAIHRGASVLVSAPTGSGKTVLADYVIERAMEAGRRVIYTAPIKALSNQKFRDFSARYGDSVGIMTGDVTLNARAPLLIMTTEIYRNTLLEGPGKLDPVAWVIFDEVHFLDDPERGTVWEEALLFSPNTVNLLALSATIPNVEELAAWIRAIHGRPIDVIEETHRPVPLTVMFQCQNQLFDSLDKLKPHLQTFQEEAARMRRHPARRWRARRGQEDFVHPNRFDKLVRHLVEAERLPCIFFTFGRRRTEDLALEASRLSLVSPAESRALRKMFEDLCERFELTGDRTAQALGQLIASGVAYHHAGMLPTVKEVVERCFTSRQVKLIVTTETFALGINMPARSVVLDSLSKRVDGGYQLLRRRDFLQMAGRAGRRGLDEAGFVYLRVNPLHIGFPDVTRLLHATPEPVRSRFNMAYATLLNLYRRHGRDLLAWFPKTFYYFQTSGAVRQAGLDAMTRKLELLEQLEHLGPKGLTAKGNFASWLYGYELLLSELNDAGQLHPLGPLELAVLLVALVYEPRPGTTLAKPHRMAKRLARLCHAPLERIHQVERELRISPRSKGPSFGLTHAMEAWMHNQPFERVCRQANADEGEIVRYFRMTVQLMRQLAVAPSNAPTLREAARRGVARINRDVIDAEAQLRMG